MSPQTNRNVWVRSLPNQRKNRRSAFFVRSCPISSRRLPRRVDLIDDGQVPVSALPLQLIDPDRLDPRQVQVRATPFDRQHHDEARIRVARV
jgi:hypothetical protein